MDETLVGVMEILGPAVLLILLIWLAMRGRPKGGSRPTEQPGEKTTERATDRLYK
jgi:hypothetical protein